MIQQDLIEEIKKIKRIAHLGLTYAKDEYDIDRYTELEKISLKLLSIIADQPLEAVEMYFNEKKEYITPKVDIRSVIFNREGHILLVREKSDGRWSLPGGWADIGDSPKETAEKEAFEETGLKVKASRLLAVLDKRCHPHPPAPDYVYKLFIQCEIVEESWTEAFDILDKGFFSEEEIPELSEERVLKEQISLMFEYLHDPFKETIFD